MAIFIRKRYFKHEERTIHMHRIIVILMACVFFFCIDAEAGRSRGGSHSRSSSSYVSRSGGHRAHPSYSHRSYSSHAGRQLHTTAKHRSSYAAAAPRDSHGRIRRSQTARHDFMKQTGYPHGRPGYVIDHVVPLAKGGADAPSNMQWQTKADAKAKDKWERK
jgi:hypothetical protein